MVDFGSCPVDRHTISIIEVDRSSRLTGAFALSTAPLITVQGEHLVSTKPFYEYVFILSN